MRDRFLLTFLTLVLAVLAVFLVERGYATSALVESGEQRAVDRSAEVVAAFVAESGGEVTPALLRNLSAGDDEVVYVDSAGVRVEAPGASDAGGSEEGLTATRPVRGGGTVTVTRTAEAVDDLVEDALLTLVLVGLGLAVASVVATALITRRMTRPFVALAEVAGRVGRGDYDVDIPRSDVPEADAVARALRITTTDLDGLVRRERRLAAQGSHELRTPLTAARLELEDLALSADTPPEVAARVSAATVQLDRLGDAVATMLDTAREGHAAAGGDIDLAALVRDTVAGWQRHGRGRALVADADGVVAVRLPVGSLVRVLDVLIGNAVTHGSGTVTVAVTSTPAYAEVRIADEGRHHVAAAGPRGAAARGEEVLSTAIRIVEALGGRLRLTERSGTTCTIVLPRAPRETDDS